MKILMNFSQQITLNKGQVNTNLNNYVTHNTKNTEFISYKNYIDIVEYICNNIEMINIYNKDLKYFDMDGVIIDINKIVVTYTYVLDCILDIH